MKEKHNFCWVWLNENDITLVIRNRMNPRREHINQARELDRKREEKKKANGFELGIYIPMRGKSTHGSDKMVYPYIIILYLRTLYTNEKKEDRTHKLTNENDRDRK